METTRDWGKIIQRIERLMRLKSFPVAFKMLEKKEDLDKISFLRRPQNKMTMCQMINLARNFDWTVGADLDDFLFPSCSSIIGLQEVPATHQDGTFRNIVWVATKEDGRKFEQAIPRLPVGRYEALAMAPLVYNPFEPDIVLIYANPAQIMLLINALQFSNYEAMQFGCVGESSCSDAIVRCYQSGKPSLGIPCYGERRYGHAQDDELVMAVPAALMTKALSGMEALYRRGVRYPISFAGAEGDLSVEFPVTYKKLDEMMAKVRGQDQRLLVGVTGGIASGKSTVSKMLEEFGAPLIDFDLIARQVVEPGTPGLAKIVDYFGSQVLDEHGALDRKKLSDIVFGDMEKRKKLEGFTHPPIYEEFFKQADAIAAKDPNAIIQVAIPLLVELNLQYLFDQLIVVHVPAATQIERLALRDGITEEAAATILKAQLPIDEKLQFANFVVDNTKDVAETKQQVEDIWHKLTQLQRKE
ncbi:MAG: dephospho-CoA kinase [Deltaproteobacteria bacterium]|nr:dephospho-CoA kinase [Candidatus Anaeroferrophillus wilburensis]MBN2889572.1 dephospho-CoA kinase [Deltaproteobacteria bacterium]